MIANMVTSVPTGPVNDIKMEMADKATIGKMQYPRTLTTTVKLTGEVDINESKP